MQDDLTLSRDSALVYGLFDALALQPADALLALIGAFRSDPRPDKIDVGVGVYRDPAGRTPVLRAVKAAEQRLLEVQETKAYLGPEGDIGFFERLKPIIFGQDMGDRLVGLQTVGGTGALRLAAELVGRARPGGRIWVGNPTWANHPPVFRAGGLSLEGYEHFDAASQTLRFEALLEALGTAAPGDVALLHGCCHNPTGADFTLEQWTASGGLLAERGVVPLIDLAYQGLGQGLEADAAGARIVLEQVGEGLLAYSCDKNFGLYRERVGALYALSANAAQAKIVQSNLLSLTRANWSMPADHGAATVRLILEDERLAADWRAELDEMSGRIRELRALLSAAHPRLAPLRQQQGMFSTLPLTPADVAALRERHGIYMPSSGRINIAGLHPEIVPPFVAALTPYL
jgi:aromatic-amino-acid transaminase